MNKLLISCISFLLLSCSNENSNNEIIGEKKTDLSGASVCSSCGYYFETVKTLDEYRSSNPNTTLYKVKKEVWVQIVSINQYNPGLPIYDFTLTNGKNIKGVYLVNYFYTE